jgi:hypothetical protein
MNSIFKLILRNKFNAVSNLDYLLNSISNVKEYINTPFFHLHNLITIRNKISNPITEFVTSNEIKSIDLVANEFISPDFGRKIFRHKDLSGKLAQLWNILNDIRSADPTQVVECVISAVEKKIPQRLSETKKNEFRDNYLQKFLLTSKKVNTVTDFIFEHVKSDMQTGSLDVLSICGILISFVVNSQSHLYFAMENIKKALSVINKKDDIEEIFSIESKVLQNTQIVTDIQAIRNAVSHGSFDIRFNYSQNEYIVDFESVLTGYQFNKSYTGRQLLLLYSDYDKLRDFQELLIRIAFLKATLRLYLFKI